MKEKLKSINNIPFLVCLGILLLNDFYLKAEYHNWLIGKLSDFCGLFIFASFWTALFPKKKLTVYFSTALIDNTDRRMVLLKRNDNKVIKKHLVKLNCYSF